MTDEDQAPVDQTPEEEQVQERRLLEALDREGEIAQMKALLTSEATRDLLWRVLSKCNVFASVFDNNYGKMAFNEGRRSVGVWLLSEICEADPNAEMLMRQKANQLAHDVAKRERESRMRRRRT
jgi:hypothetical protein